MIKHTLHYIYNTHAHFLDVYFTALLVKSILILNSLKYIDHQNFDLSLAIWHIFKVGRNSANIYLSNFFTVCLTSGLLYHYYIVTNILSLKCCFY